MSNYKVIQNSSHYILQEEVTKYMQQGWIPQGGVCIYLNGVFGNATTYAQAMILTGKPNTGTNK